MLSRKIIANSIKNLTDARYFAAWMVDYMSFDFQSDSQNFIGAAKIIEIMNWLEGPVFIGDFSGHRDPGFVLSTINEIGLSGLITDQVELITALSKEELEVFLVGGDPQINLSEEYNLIVTNSKIGTQKDKDIYLDVSKIPVSEMETIDPALGFLIAGGEEEKVGLKSFDELDELFEILAD